MPIKPENAARYPSNWKEIRNAVLERAGHRCEWCGVLNHSRGMRDRFGTFHNADQAFTPQELLYLFGDTTMKVIRIVLTIAHLDHTPENCDPKNLAALCQRCHCGYDAQHHALSRMETRRKKLELALPDGMVQIDIDSYLDSAEQDVP